MEHQTVAKELVDKLTQILNEKAPHQKTLNVKHLFAFLNNDFTKPFYQSFVVTEEVGDESVGIFNFDFDLLLINAQVVVKESTPPWNTFPISNPDGVAKLISYISDKTLPQLSQ